MNKRTVVAISADKLCARCRIKKGVDNFYNDSTKKNGLDSWCKDCRKEYEKSFNFPPKTTGTKICIRCKKEKRITEFMKVNRNRDGRSATCKLCKKAGRKEYRAKPDVIKKTAVYNKEYKLLINYGISIKDKNSIVEKQGGKCAICGNKLIDSKNKTCVDHNHKTGEIRGILCNCCNRGLGLFKDSKQNLINAADYLERHE